MTWGRNCPSDKSVYPNHDKVEQYRPAFPTGRSQSCFCESGCGFKHFCGSADSRRLVPHGVEIVENFLSPAECQDWVQLAAALTSHRPRMIDWKAADPSTARKLDDRRVIERVDKGEDREQQLCGLLERFYVSDIAKKLGRRFAWFESPQVFKYNVGGFYEAHVDTDFFDPERRFWRHHGNRDISRLLYLNDDFEGEI